MQADRDTFGPRLRLEREKRGITLKHIAESTKIKESLFAELERGDLSKWPQGIFRRAHLCAYISAIGLPSQPILNEFLQLFPDEHLLEQNAQNAALKASDGSTAADMQPQIAQPTVAVRYAALLDRAWIVFFDLAAICLISSIVAAVSGSNLYLAVALVGLVYFAAGSACCAGSIGGYVQHWIHQFVQSRNHFELIQLIQAPLREMRLVRPTPNSHISASREEPEIQQERASA